jgi:hypothetical protein
MSIGLCDCGFEEVSASSAIAQYTLFTAAADGLPLYMARVSAVITSAGGPSRNVDAKVRSYQNGVLGVRSSVSLNSGATVGERLVDFDTFWADPGTDVKFEVTEESGFAAAYQVYLKVAPL